MKLFLLLGAVILLVMVLTPYFLPRPLQIIDSIPKQTDISPVNPFDQQSAFQQKPKDEQASAVLASLIAEQAAEQQKRLLDQQHQFVLIGVILDDVDPKALINIDGEYEWLFRINDELVDGWLLANIERQQVELINGEERMLVRMSGALDVSDQFDQRETQAYIDPREEKRLNVLKRLESPAFFSKVLTYLDGRHPTEAEFPVGVDTYGVYQKENHIEIHRDEIVSQLSSARMHRHIAYDKQEQGLRVREVVPGSVFDKAGLQVGDLLISIDGIRLSNYDSLLALYKELFYADSFTLALKRKNQSLSQRYIII